MIIKTEAYAMSRPSIYVVMGVSGCGKSTLGKALAETLNCPFYEGDDYHPSENIEKMAAGIALDDSDRLPWLALLRHIILKHLDLSEPAVISCSALKRQYRDAIGREASIQYLYLATTAAQLNARVASRSNHFMPSSLITSQLQTLEIPRADEQALCLDAALPVTQLIGQVCTHSAIQETAAQI